MTDVEMIRASLEQLLEGVQELSSTQAEQGARLAAIEGEMARLRTAINGADDVAGAPGIKTRLALLESRSRDDERSGARDALATVERVRAEAEKNRWATALGVVKAVGPTIAAVAAAVGAHLAWK